MTCTPATSLRLFLIAIPFKVPVSLFPPHWPLLCILNMPTLLLGRPFPWVKCVFMELFSTGIHRVHSLILRNICCYFISIMSLCLILLCNNYHHLNILYLFVHSLPVPFLHSLRLSSMRINMFLLFCL